jgi:Flp pilus assembly pilin Flp
VLNAQAKSPTGDGAKRRGATAVEYLFALSLIIVVCIATVTYFGDKVQASLKDSASKVPDGSKNK